MYICSSEEHSVQCTSEKTCIHMYVHKHTFLQEAYMYLQYIVELRHMTYGGMYVQVVTAIDRITI